MRVGSEDAAAIETAQRPRAGEEGRRGGAAAGSAPSFPSHARSRVPSAPPVARTAPSPLDQLGRARPEARCPRTASPALAFPTLHQRAAAGGATGAVALPGRPATPTPRRQGSSASPGKREGAGPWGLRPAACPAPATAVRPAGGLRPSGAGSPAGPGRLDERSWAGQLPGRGLRTRTLLDSAQGLRRARSRTSAFAKLQGGCSAHRQRLV